MKSNKPFQLLPEWHKQKAVLVTWPHAYSDWRPMLADINKCYQAMVSTMAEYQQVVVICYNELHQDHIKKTLLNKANLDNILFIDIKTNDTWIRDYGPITVKQGDKHFWLDMQFNAWGGKFDCDLDNAVTQQLAQHEFFQDYECIESNWVTEGGSIETDGDDILLSTASCMLDPKRNPDMTENELSNTVYSCFGTNKLMLLQHPALEGDDTDGHIDTIARFCSPTQLCYAHTKDADHPHYRALNMLQSELTHLPPEGIETTAIPHPPVLHSADGDILPATYANFLITNEKILVPTYQASTDDEAIHAIHTLFPKHEAIGIDCRTLIEQNGSLHCATMQLM